MLEKSLLGPVGCFSLAETSNRAETQQRQDATIFFYQASQLCSYIVSLLSSNLNSKLFRFHCVRPNLDRNL